MKRESRSEACESRRTRVPGDGGGLAAPGVNLRQGGPTLADERHLRGQLVVPSSPSTLHRANSAPRNLVQARVHGVETSDPQAPTLPQRRLRGGLHRTDRQGAWPCHAGGFARERSERRERSGSSLTHVGRPGAGRQRRLGPRSHKLCGCGCDTGFQPVKNAAGGVCAEGQTGSRLVELTLG